MDEHPLLERLVEVVQSNPRYRNISPALVRRIGSAELAKPKDFKEAVKATRNKLHQVGGAYVEKPVDFDRWSGVLSGLPHNDTLALRDFCRQMMALHASTRERLPALEHIFVESLATLAPVRSVLDLACGLNPLALPWMPLADRAPYYACDIYQDMVTFIGRFLSHLNLPGGAELCDLVQLVPDHPVHVALLLKTIPCLEQLDRDVAPRLLEHIPAEHLLVSFPARSLGGHNKGMPANYEAHFRELVAGKPWAIHRFEFPGELVFLINR